MKDIRHSQQSRHHSQTCHLFTDESIITTETSAFTKQAASAKTTNTTLKQKSEYGVIVYGFTQDQFGTIITHFGKFGPILENFTQTSKGLSNVKGGYPIYMGPNWVKLTYDDSSSMARALAENGNMANDGQIVSVVQANGSTLAQFIANNTPLKKTSATTTEETVALVAQPILQKSNRQNLVAHARTADGDKNFKASAGQKSLGNLVSSWVFGVNQV